MVSQEETVFLNNYTLGTLIKLKWRSKRVLSLCSKYIQIQTDHIDRKWLCIQSIYCWNYFKSFWESLAKINALIVYMLF